MGLHNLATEATDHITFLLVQPTITLLRKVRRVARGHMVREKVEVEFWLVKILI